jgi:hypothetical protein
MERSVGHGRGTSLADLVQRQARQLAFFTLALHLDSPTNAPTIERPSSTAAQ